MKKILIYALSLLALLLLLPLITLNRQNTSAPAAAPAAATVNAALKTDTIKVLISATGEVEEMPIEEYLFGVVSSEMPALYETEALKAQAVCAYTFALKRKADNTDKPYDITDNFQTDQCYISREERQKNWGSKADEYTQKIEQAIHETENLSLTYNGEIILSVYHAVSSGTTEKAANVWGKGYPYLQSVSSVGDKLATNYISTCEITAEKLKEALNLSENITGNPFTDFTRTEAGTVKTVKVYGKEYKGSEIRELFDLKSANFETDYKDGKLTFTVYGYGHGVGLSQNGANYMAQQGSDFKEILLHYYKGAEITDNS